LAAGREPSSSIDSTSRSGFISLTYLLIRLDTRKPKQPPLPDSEIRSHEILNIFLVFLLYLQPVNSQQAPSFYTHISYRLPADAALACAFDVGIYTRWRCMIVSLVVWLHASDVKFSVVLTPFAYVLRIGGTGG
jgi:hypothetical protein